MGGDAPGDGQGGGSGSGRTTLTEHGDGFRPARLSATEPDPR